MSNKGFILLDREIVDHWVFQRDPEYRIWNWILFKAQFDKAKKPIIVGAKEMYLDRGEFCCKIQNVADFLQLDYNQVRRVFDLFKRNNMIEKIVGRGYKIPYVAYMSSNTINQQSIDNQSTINLLLIYKIIITLIILTMDIMKMGNGYINVRFVKSKRSQNSITLKPLVVTKVW